MSAKIISVRSAVAMIALILALTGCKPSGDRAALKGAKCLAAGDNAAAVAQFKIATDLLATNAAAWNYYGVALQRNNQPLDSANAYRRAIDLDRNLIDARFNLGTLYLEQNQPEAAKSEFTAYTLRRPNDAVGWLNLGTAQLRLRETTAAERSFSSVLSLKTNEAEAYNGLGLARMQRNRPRDAVQFFAAAVQTNANYAPALLNLANVSQQYLGDNRTAKEYYAKYLNLIPRPDNWETVKAIADALHEPILAGPVTATQRTNTTPLPGSTEPKLVLIRQTNTPPTSRSPQQRLPDKSEVAESGRTPPPPPTKTATGAVKVVPEPQIVSVGGGTPMPESVPLESTTREESKPGFWNRLLGTAKPEKEPKVLPLTPAPISNQPPVVLFRPASGKFPRYQYTSPARPQPGDRKSATEYFNQGYKLQQSQNWTAAFENFSQAAALDPAWFEAQFNAAIMGERMHNTGAALAAYERALALRPDSIDAHYSFALALKSGGYAPDAERELKQILANHPNDSRTHLALGNLSAQTLHDPSQARKHYLKVLELAPNIPQANSIRHWLVANPE